jgi:hypothetical protein
VQKIISLLLFTIIIFAAAVGCSKNDHNQSSDLLIGVSMSTETTVDNSKEHGELTKVSYRTTLKNVSDGEMEIEWAEAVISKDLGDIGTGSLLSEIHQGIPAGEQLYVEGTFEYNFNKNKEMSHKELILGYNVKLQKGEVIYVEV